MRVSRCPIQICPQIKIYHAYSRNQRLFYGMIAPLFTEKHPRSQEDTSMQPQPTRTANLSPSFLKAALTRYYRELDTYNGIANYELAVRSAFQNLLSETARQVGLKLIPEQTLPNGTRPDGTLRDDFFARGYWEAKGPDKDLEKEIAERVQERLSSHQYHFRVPQNGLSLPE